MDGDGDDDDDFCIRENEDVVAPIPKRETNSFVNVSIIVKKWQKCVSLMALSGLQSKMRHRIDRSTLQPVLVPTIVPVPTPT